MADWRARLPLDRREFKPWIRRLNGVLFELEHFVNRPDGPKTKPVGNVAVVVLKDGRAFVGKSKCSDTDQWNHKRGFNIAVGRALKRAWQRVAIDMCIDCYRPIEPIENFTVPMNGNGAPIGGVELRDYCRQRVGL